MSRHGRHLSTVRLAVALTIGAAGGLAVLGAGGVPVAGAATTATLFAKPGGATSGACTSTSQCTAAYAVDKAESTHHTEAVTVHLAAGTYTKTVIGLTATALTSLSVVGAGTAGSGATVLESTAATPVAVVAGSGTDSFSELKMSSGTGTDGCISVTPGPTVSVTLTHVAIDSCVNTVTDAGGGIEIGSGATVSIATASFDTDSASVQGGGIDNHGTLTLDKVTVDHDSSVFGGGIDTWHRSTIENSTFDHDHSGDGGAILVQTGGTATLTGDTLTSNTTTADGGAISVEYGSILHVTSSTIASNTATTTGGGIYAKSTGTHATVSGSTIAENSGGSGGGVATVTEAKLTLTSDTLSADGAKDFGGGVYNFAGTVTVAGATFLGDTTLATGKGGGVMTETAKSTLTNATFATDTAGYGGAVETTGMGTTTLTDDTLANDSATHTGGGIYGAAKVDNSILSDATCAAAITDQKYNVATTNSCHLGANSKPTSTAIGLLPLAANTSSGPRTLAITPKSSAFEEVPAAACITVKVDERGFPRPGAPTKNCDAGAYEYQLTGYDMVGSDGGVFVFNPPGVTNGFYGSLPGIHVVPNKPVVGMVPTVKDTGYFLVAQDGGVFAFGTAPFLGSLPGIKVTPNLPIVGIVAANTDKGYFLVGADGGVYAFGTVPFLGSLPGTHISLSNIIGIAATPSGNGYWVVAATGTVYAFGAAKKFTSIATTSPVTAIAGTPTGGGYWLVTKEGRVYPYGNAAKPGQGTLPAIHVVPNLPVIGIVRVAATVGYWMIGQDGGIFAFGTAPFVGSLPGLHVSVNDIVGAVPN